MLKDFRCDFCFFLIGVLKILLACVSCTAEKVKYHMFSLICGIYFLKMNGRARCWWLMLIIFDTSGLRSGGVWLKSSPASGSWDPHLKKKQSKVPWRYGSRSKEPAFWVWSPEVTHQSHYKKRTTEMWDRFCWSWCQQEGEKWKESMKDVNMLKVLSTHEWKYNYDAFWNYFRNSGRADEEER
jgi:hypothetical protein